MAHDVNLAAVCGLYCGACELLDKQCRGCGHVEGKPFWIEQFGVKVCPLYGCCRGTRRLEHCGLCADFPCQVFLEMRDPALSDEEARKSQEARQADLRRRRQVGTEEWLKGKARQDA